MNISLLILSGALFATAAAALFISSKWIKAVKKCEEENLVKDSVILKAEIYDKIQDLRKVDFEYQKVTFKFRGFLTPAAEYLSLKCRQAELEQQFLNLNEQVKQMESQLKTLEDAGL